MRRTVMLATVISIAGLAAAVALASTGAAQAPGPPTGAKQLLVRQVSFMFLDHPPRRSGDGPPSPEMVDHRPPRPRRGGQRAPRAPVHH